LNEDEQKKFVAEVFNNIMRDLTERAKIDLETINNIWFVELLTIVIEFDAQDLTHNAKELI